MSDTQSKNEQWCEDLAKAIKPFVRYAHALAALSGRRDLIVCEVPDGMLREQILLTTADFIRLADVVDGRDNE